MTLNPQTGRAGRRVRAGLGLRAGRCLGAWAWDCARGPVDDGVRGAGAVRVGPFAGGLNPLMRSWALLVAVWAACLGYHLWG